MKKLLSETHPKLEKNGILLKTVIFGLKRLFPTLIASPGGDAGKKLTINGEHKLEGVPFWATVVLIVLEDSYRQRSL